MSEADLTEQLNTFYTRFDSVDFKDELSHFRNGPLGCKTIIDQATVCCLGGKLLKKCARQLSGILTHMFQSSFEIQKVPRIWKESIVVPVAKVPSPKTWNDYRPIALSSLAMKTFEHIDKVDLLNSVQDMLDPFQFAYKANRGVEDATATLILYWGMWREARIMHAFSLLIFHLLLIVFSHTF